MTRLSGVLKSPVDPRDHKYVATITALPELVDLIPEVEEIENQGGAGSCTAHATTTAVEVFDNRGGYTDKLSPQFIYDLTRSFENRPDQSGANLRDALEMGRQHGFCLESEYPYTGVEKTGKPPEYCYVSGALRKITKYEAVDIPTIQNGMSYWDGVDKLKSALAEGLPVVVAMRVFRPIFYLKGPLKDQTYITIGTDFVGNHAVTIVGYDDSFSGFVYANSWSKTWGDGGFGRLPYQSFGDIFEAWVIRGYRDILIEAPKPVIEPPSPVPTPEPPKPIPPVPVPEPEKRKTNYAAFIAAATILVIALVHFGGVLAEKFKTETPSRIENER